MGRSEVAESSPGVLDEVFPSPMKRYAATAPAPTTPSTARSCFRTRTTEPDGCSPGPAPAWILRSSVAADCPWAAKPVSRHEARAPHGGDATPDETPTDTAVEPVLPWAHGYRTRRESPGRPHGPSMIPTDHYLRFERVDEVSETERGIEAALHGERLQVDLVTDDVVRIRISRGGSFDDQPTYAVCVDPMARPVEHQVEHGDGVVRLRTSGLQLTLGLDPFRIDVHRPGRLTGRRDRRRRRRPPVGLRDAERRVHGPPPVPPGGRGLRPGREDRPAQPQGPRLHDVEPRRAEPGAECRVHGRARSGRPAIGQLQHGVRPVLRVDPALPPPRRPDLGRGLLVPRQRLPHALRLLPVRGVPDPRRGRAVRRVRVRRAAAPRRPRGVHAPDREGRPTAVVVPGVPPVPLVRLHPGDR